MIERAAFQQHIGVLGGGQLGKMLYAPAARLDLSIQFMDPDPDCPCAHSTPVWVEGALTSKDDVLAFGADKDVLTIEIEHVDAETLFLLEAGGKLVYPQPHVIATIQDKRKQKAFFEKHGFPTTPFVLIENKAEGLKHQDFLPAFNKLGVGGYDGKGVKSICTKEDLEHLFDAPGILEKAVSVQKELSVVVARNALGVSKAYPVVELVFDPQYHLVDYLLAPARIPESIADQAIALSLALADRLGIVGLLAVELFLTKENILLINEMAPRTHNSGHHTIEACDTSQFEQQLRAILNLPLGSTALRKPAAMINIVGSDGHEGPPMYPGIESLMAQNGVFVHLYGKKITKPGRKMGHVTVLAESVEELVDIIERIRPFTNVKTM